MSVLLRVSDISILKSVPMMKVLGDDELGRIAKMMRIKSYQDGDAIITKGALPASPAPPAVHTCVRPARF